MRNGRCCRNRSRKNLRDIRSVPRSENEEYVNLKKWIAGFDKHCNIKLTPCDFLETGRGLRTKTTINQGEIILSIPECVLITPERVLCSKIGHILKKFRPPLSPQRILATFLVFEAKQRKDSFWYPYIRTLPAAFNTPLYFSPDDLSRLPPSTHRKACREQSRVAAIFNNIHKLLARSCSSVEYFTYEAFRWAWCVVNTRSVYVKSPTCPYIAVLENESNVALAPYLDLLNHSPYAKTEAQLNKTSGRFEITTLDHYAPYEQVFINYNPHGNESLLMEYGFVVPRNPYSTLEFTLDDVAELKDIYSIEHWGKKQQIIEENALTTGLSCTLEGMSWNLHTLLRIVCMSWEELLHWRAVYRGEISPENEAHVLEMAVSMFSSALQIQKKYLVKKTDSMSDNAVLALTLVQDHVDILEHSLQLLKN